MSFTVTGEIKKILEVETIQGKEKTYKKVQFVLDSKEQYNNEYCFEVFGEEKVDNFIKYNKEGKVVKVDFNVGTNEYKGKYYTKLSAWKVFNESAPATANETKLEEGDDDLPF